MRRAAGCVCICVCVVFQVSPASITVAAPDKPISSLSLLIPSHSSNQQLHQPAGAHEDTRRTDHLAPRWTNSASLWSHEALGRYIVCVCVCVSVILGGFIISNPIIKTTTNMFLFSHFHTFGVKKIEIAGKITRI